jgi:AraC-like DNA-binding protein/mannose-6-phosphate isomerase-like protein (cupin superfamily)
MDLDDDLRGAPVLEEEYFPFNVFHNHKGIFVEKYNSLPLHWHEEIEILYLQQGCALFAITGQEFHAKPGDIFVVNRREIHSVTPEKGEELNFYAVVFKNNLFAGQCPDSFFLRHISPFLEGEVRCLNRILCGDDAMHEIQNLMRTIIHEFGEKSPGYRLIIKSHLIALVTRICRLNLRNDMKKSEAAEIPERFYKLFSYIENHYPEKISAADAARQVNYSRQHFSLLFKKLTGMSFVHFLHLYRVNAAEKLLAETSMPVTEVAEKTGFCNINYFDKTFRKLKGCSPSDMRRELQQTST